MKRKLDYVYKTDRENNQSGSADVNNAQAVRTNKQAKFRKKSVNKRDTFEDKNVKFPKINDIVNFDGVQVTVNSDEEDELDLDYADDLNCDDEEGSIMEEEEQNIDNNTESENNVLRLGATSANLSEEEMIMNNPHPKRLLNKMLDERIQNAKKSDESSGSELLSKMTTLLLLLEMLDHQQIKGRSQV